uniref:Transcriptional regulator MraZ n=1 Tax=uncultured bacterium contig00015 TaxID=1181506 RepID=A0A806KI55_9BACT|nr:cell division protein MraZ [uncultured bacterium contig00015]
MELELLTGTFETTLDDKNRVVVPASLREHYTGALYLIRGVEKCVWVMTPDNYYKKLEDFREQAQTKGFNAGQIDAFYYQHVTTRHKVEVDVKTGRIQVPAPLKSYAKLEKDCLVVCSRDHLEIWNTELNNDFMEEVRIVNKDIHNKMSARADFLPGAGQE